VKGNVASISNTKRLTWRLGAWVRRALISYLWVSRADMNKMDGVINLHDVLNLFGVSLSAQSSGSAKAARVRKTGAAGS